jgi:hypothetical protein
MKKIRNQILKLLNYKYSLTKTINFNFFINQINFVKNQKRRYVSYLLCDLFKLIFSILFEEDIE